MHDQVFGVYYGLQPRTLLTGSSIWKRLLSYLLQWWRFACSIRSISVSTARSVEGRVGLELIPGSLLAQGIGMQHPGFSMHLH